MGRNRILIVDDEESIAEYLVKSLRLLAPEYDVETARSARGALAMMNRQPFDVMVTDLRMPGMDGLELMRRVRERHPHVRLILSTAYGDDKVEAQAYQIGACRYLSKPFKAEELVDALRQAVAPAATPALVTPVAPEMQLDAISQRLSDLLFELAAHCILLADVSGTILAQVGDPSGVDPAALVSLIGGGLATSFELARSLHETEAVTLKYLEGASYDIYASNIDTKYFVVIVYDKRGGQGSRLGMVWLYLRRALTELQNLIHGTGPVPAAPRRTPPSEPARATTPPRSTRTETPRRGAEPPTWRRETAPDVYSPPPRQEAPAPAARRRGTEPGLPPRAEPATPAGDQPRGRDQEPKEPPLKAAVPPEPPAPPTETFDLAQAIAMGLLDASWFQDMEEEGDKS